VQVGITRRLADSRERGAALTRSLDALMDGLPEADRAPLVARLSALRTEVAPPARARGRTPATAAVLA